MNSPPRWAQKLLEVFSDPDTMEEVQGDLLELYDHWVQTIGKRRADWRYSRSTLKLLRPLAQTNTTQYPSPFFLNPAMIRNYFRTAWRNLVKNKFYSFINISGLTVGLAVGILILLWVQDELSFDRFHTQSSSIYRLENWAGTGSSRQIWTATVAPIAGFAKRETPEVKDAVRLTENYAYTLFKYREKTISEHKTFFTDPTLFSVFDFNLIQGNPAKPFPNNNSIVVTETTAKRYFGDENPIGKVLAANDNTAFTVSGVIRDFPKNSSIQGDMFLPMSLFFKNIYADNRDGKNMDNDFSQFRYYTYLLLQPNTSVASLATKLRTIHLRNKPDDTDLTYLLQALPDMHLYKADGTEGGIETVRMFSIIALLILAIACINYVNLSTARSLLRSKEVSMRKIVGAARSQLFIQFLVETTLLFALAAALAIGLLFGLLPFYNQLSGKELVLNVSDYRIWQIIGLTIIGTLAASSIYPAVLLSSFEPLKALKGKVSARLSEASFRKLLVVVQFAVSVILIAGTFIINNQLQYIRSKELGYDKTHVFAFFMRDMSKHYDAVKADLLNQPGVAAITRADADIVALGGQTGDNAWDGKAQGETMMMYSVAIDKDFIPFFNMKLQQGANFTGAVADSLHFILNESAVKAARLDNPIGKRFRLWKHNGTIIGVVKDFHFASMKQKIEPSIFYYEPQNSGVIYIKTTGKEAEQAIASAKQSWKQYNADFPFVYSFLDDVFNNLYKSEQQTGLLFTIFSSIAILISCLGLFGLAAYTAQVRTREIGVRKVLGASVTSVIQLLAKDFIQLVLIAIVIAVPLAWWAMSLWLEGFAYRIDIAWWMFAIAGLLALAIALLTVSFQSIKAALMNPVKSLRSE
ncbi:ABC transporter permease [Spirosoma utsteinense]|uniref:ABC transport system permease protein n=2 Tax=Spirosoma utsteinense TaxID=2585773 RepID=A0ABR6W233_9BACT|nr:ABC transporter permease [Spirosoma utsteinense]MBC3790642.1 putative ABC transport system permease protein [Spirosoma utsteinense]